MRRLTARCVLLEPGRELSPGEIIWDRDGRITALRRPTGPVADLCVLPGLVNAHVHLQIEPVAAPRAFLPWVAAVMAARAAQTPSTGHAAVRAAVQALRVDGVTAIGEIDSTGLSPRALARSNLAGRCYQELVGFDADASAARRLVRQRRRAGSPALAAGLSPHAPYSVSGALFAAAAAASHHLAIHCAEVPEEQQFLHSGRGPFADLLAALGKLPANWRAPRLGAVAWLECLGVLRRSTQLVHCQELERPDVARIAAAGASIVVCPGTIAWFHRPIPPVPRWLAAGIPVGLGTDSRASNAQFSLRAALQAAARWWPGLSPTELLRMATCHGGRALGKPGLGRLRRGGRADLLALPARGDAAADHVAAFVHGDLAPAFVLARGVRYSVEPPARRPYSDRS